ncbi:hypothetical protein [Synechococcus phage BUCT-ZZ01]|nr:hypothetical protein [Synechococcus phage BUCT-ZZ01]
MRTRKNKVQIFERSQLFKIETPSGAAIFVSYGGNISEKFDVVIKEFEKMVANDSKIKYAEIVVESETYKIKMVD